MWLSEGRCLGRGKIKCKFWGWESVCCALEPARDGVAGVERVRKKEEMQSDNVGDRLGGQMGCWKNLGGAGKPLEGSELWSNMT